MPKMNFKRVLEALSGNISGLSSSSSNQNIEPNFSSTLTADQFQPYKISRHGFPYRPTAFAYDPVQKLIAIGTYAGTIRIIGCDGVDRYITHESDKPVINLIFLNNQGALISVCADDAIHLWNLRQTQPAILHSLQFNRERITCCNLPHGSKWLYIGTDKGNVHLCHIESFTLSGYSISWNKAIELSQKSHPGQVIAISENPCNESRIIIAFQCGSFVLWDLKQKQALQRYFCNNTIHQVCWHQEGKQFMCSHNDGLISLWSVTSSAKPLSFQRPHGKHNKLPRPLRKLTGWAAQTRKEIFESLVIFSGGLLDDYDSQPSITIMQGKSITVLEMGSPVVDFIAVSSTPWKCDNQDPTDILILLNKELVVLDLKTPGYPCIEPPHALDIHDSPVTCLEFFLDTDATLLPTLQHIAALKPHNSNSSKKAWPISGGESKMGDYEGIPELLVSGHADGSVRFWDATAGFLKPIYKLRTYKIFHRARNSSGDEEEDLCRITNIALCTHTQTLITTNVSSTIIIYKLNASEIHTEITFLPSNITCLCARLNCPRQPTLPEPIRMIMVNLRSRPIAPHPTQVLCSTDGDNYGVAKSSAKSGSFRQSPGFQSNFLCLLSDDGTSPPMSVFLSVDTVNNLLSVGTIMSLCVIDLTQKSLLFNVNTNNVLLSIDGKMQISKLRAAEKEDSLTNLESGSAVPSTKSKRHIKISKKNTSLSLEKSIGSLENFDDHVLSRGSSSNDSDQPRLNECVTLLTFSSTHLRKSYNSMIPCLWVGTQSGCLFSIAFNNSDRRNNHRVAILPLGTLLQLNGAIVSCVFMSSTGQVLEGSTKLPSQLASEEKADHDHDTTGDASRDIQFMVVTSERQVKTFSFPGLSCIHVYDLPLECGQFIRSSVDTLMSGVCSACYTSNGHIVVLTLPSLNTLLNVAYLPTDERIAHTFCFTSDGQAMFLPTPTEIQRIAYYGGIHENVQELVGHLFFPCPDVEKPATGFLKGLFGGGYTSLDRDSLFGENVNGKTKSIAKLIPGTGGSSFEGFRHGEFSKLKNQVVERGERLGELEEATQRLHDSASRFSAVSHAVMLKYKNKKWYQM
uniref:Lethal giant larvae homologue 2 domain-containing protein n=1 Tax=Ciona savignyi TaxID=51511 RepID=H2ZJQ8_CIOSA